MRLFCCECRKIWGNSIVQRAILLSFLLDICVIGILAFRDNQSFPISEYRAICEAENLSPHRHIWENWPMPVNQKQSEYIRNGIEGFPLYRMK